MTLKYSNFRVKPTIVNGHPVRTGEHPYLVSIKEPVYSVVHSRIWLNLCGGSIISETKVLTAAHCFEENNFYYRTHPGILRLVAGHLDTIINTTLRELPTLAQSRKIHKLLIHGDFHFPANDIAVVIVNEPWNFTRAVDYLPFARSDMDYRIRCLAVGFGRTGHDPKDQVPKVLLEAYLYLMSKSKCSFIWRMDMDSYVCTDSVFSDVGRGDSGGPLVCKRTGDAGENERGVLVGVVSGKNFDKTTLFTRVAKFSNWIEHGDGSRMEVTWLWIVNILVVLVVYLCVVF